MKIDNTATAIEIFINSAIEHSKSSENGNYKSANKNHKLILESAKYLKSTNSIFELRKLYNHENMGVRIWAATYSLEDCEKNAKKVLKNISKQKINHHSFTAKITLEEWISGNLKL